MEIADQLCGMVQRRQVIELTSEKDPEEQTRIVEPHAVYIGSNNKGFVDFYQRSGWSSSGDLPGWRRFALSDITAARPTSETFEPRQDYRPENRQWYRAFVCTTATPERPAATPDISAPPDETSQPGSR